MMSAQSGPFWSRWRIRREEIASRSALSRIKTLRRCPRADEVSCKSRPRRSSLSPIQLGRSLGLQIHTAEDVVSRIYFPVVLDEQL
jgi:hypothetical protein